MEAGGRATGTGAAARATVAEARATVAEARAAEARAAEARAAEAEAAEAMVVTSCFVRARAHKRGASLVRRTGRESRTCTVDGFPHSLSRWTSVSQTVISRSRPALTPPPARSPAPPLPVEHKYRVLAPGGYSIVASERHRGEPGHTRDTRDTRGRAHAGTRITRTNLTTIHPNKP